MQACTSVTTFHSRQKTHTFSDSQHQVLQWAKPPDAESRPFHPNTQIQTTPQYSAQSDFEDAIGHIAHAQPKSSVRSACRSRGCVYVRVRRDVVHRDVVVHHDVTLRRDVVVRRDVGFRRDATLRRDVVVRRDVALRRDVVVRRDVGFRRDATLRREVSLRRDVCSRCFCFHFHKPTARLPPVFAIRHGISYATDPEREHTKRAAGAVV